MKMFSSRFDCYPRSLTADGEHAFDLAPAGEVSNVLHDIGRAELITLTFIGTC